MDQNLSCFEAFERFKDFKELLKKENEELKAQFDREKSELNESMQTYNNLLAKFEELKEKNFQLEIALKIEELKQKPCADTSEPTFESVEHIAKDYDADIDVYLKKFDEFKQEHKIDINLIKEKRLIKIKFLNNGQEILVKYANATFFKASYETCAQELDSNGKKSEMDKLIKKFNDLANKTQNLKNLIQKLIELFA